MIGTGFGIIVAEVKAHKGSLVWDSELGDFKREGSEGQWFVQQLCSHVRTVRNLVEKLEKGIPVHGCLCFIRNPPDLILDGFERAKEFLEKESSKRECEMQIFTGLDFRDGTTKKGGFIARCGEKWDDLGVSVIPNILNRVKEMALSRP